jgi:hypothetical protein
MLVSKKNPVNVPIITPIIPEERVLSYYNIQDFG